ncbi:biopolymer transporter ExbD [Pedobacter sp. SYP-B3415]|uniref:ExbD/TolR family protein n=1 Tax=Pedobacter sp. SYP-B3415 TaxID=2496641 RepID=UPI00101BFD9E|nr:biopolymer transporter ExbD [Pedobacter sp. SYP-B3415]
MATLQIPQGSKAAGRRTQKHAPVTDLTAMVDLAFLLITFFMLTTSLSRFQAMDVARPVPEAGRADYPASRTLTLILGRRDGILWYMGETGKSTAGTASFKSIRTVLLKNKQRLLDKQKDLIVIVKPSDGARYANLVDVLDELKITGVKTYVIDDADNSLAASEKEELRKRKLI